MSKFKKGDKVKILRKAESHEDGWQNSWVSQMDKAVGKIGTVIGYGGSRKDVELEVAGLKDWGYPEFVLESVTSQLELSDFKIGDIVSVKKSRDSSSTWANCQVVEISKDYVYIKREGGNAYPGGYYPYNLEKVEFEKKTENILDVARQAAVEFAKKNFRSRVNIATVYNILVEKGYQKSEIGRIAGNVFMGKNWLRVGETKSIRTGAKSRRISVWQYTGR